MHTAGTTFMDNGSGLAISAAIVAFYLIFEDYRQ
jgi:hypothetical protein